MKNPAAASLRLLVFTVLPMPFQCAEAPLQPNNLPLIPLSQQWLQVQPLSVHQGTGRTTKSS